MTDQRKPGRPYGSTSTRPTRDVIKQIRWTAEEWAQIEEDAKRSGKTVADWQREAILNYRREKERANDLHAAILQTLDENGHLADGEDCTLRSLKDAVGME